jgi:F420-dependent oxidoreductase-like protein
VRFGFKTSNHYVPWTRVRDIWTAADELVIFESGWLFDHLYPQQLSSQGPMRPTDPCLEGWTMLAALSQATHRLRLGTLVTGVHFRHPALLAKMAATLDIVSGGRLELGIGAGWSEQECAAYGIPLGGTRERLDRFDEACKVLISLLTQQSTTFHGDYFELVDAACEPKPIQRPHPPLVIGGNGERRTLPTVARMAQQWNYVGGSVDEFARKRTVLRAHCADLGRAWSDIEISAQFRLDTPSGAAALDDLVEQIRAFDEIGLDVAIVFLAPGVEAAHLAPLASALASVK